MMPNTALYAAKKRKKPVQKIPKPQPPDGAKTNPSKRHRDRLNGELDKLTSLLPFTEDVRARLDKLSVLRLSVGFLKVKSFYNATLKASQSSSSWTSERSLMFGGSSQNAAVPPSSSSSSSTSSSSVQPPSAVVTSIDGVSFSEGDLLLQALNGFVLVVTAEGYVFYTSPTIQDFLGFHQSDVIHQSVFELIHTDDRALFRRQLHFSLNPSQDSSSNPSDQSSTEITSNLINYDPQTIPPENSSFLERNFCCRFRCLLDNSSGFLALNFRGRLKLLHGQNRVSEDGTLVPPQLALFSIATPLQPPSILEIRTKTLIFQTKHKLDFSPLGIDTRGKVVLGYNEVELCMQNSGYSFLHAADMMYCADNHMRMMKTGDSGFTVFRLLTKNRSWIWVQASARVVFKGGKPDFIVARQRALTNEEGEEQLRLRRLQLPFNFTTGEAVLYDTTPTVEMPDPCSAPKQRKLDDYTVSRDSLLGCMLSQDQSIYCENNANTLSSLNDVAFKDTHATVNVPGDMAPKPAVGGLMKAEATMQDMIETLQQILGDSELTETVDVGPEELKTWESALLKMNFSSCEFSEDLNDIISNDILTYVEEQLQKEGGFSLPDQLDDIPCLSSLDLQNQDPDQPGEQTFSWPLEPQNQLMPSGGHGMVPRPAPALGSMKLSHMDFPQLSSARLNGPSIQQNLQQSLQQSLQQNLQQNLQQSLPAPLQLGAAGNIGGLATFNPSVVDSCQVNKDNSLGSFSHQIHPNQMGQPMQNNLQMRNQPMGLQDQNTGRQFDPVFGFQGSGWNPPLSNQVDSFVETFAPSISNEAGFSGPSSSGCLQGHFALQSQSADTQRQSWSLEQQLLTSGHQQMGSCLSQVSGDVRPPFRTAETSGASFPHQQNSEASSSTSCMFTNPALPRNRVHLNQARINPATNQIASKPSCFYEALPGGGSMPVMAAVPNPDEASLSCQMAAGLNPNGLLVQQQQQFLNFSEQTQINNHPVVGNGGFPFSSLPNGNTCYSENK